METGLVRKIKDGDREAFDRFCLTLYPAMLSYAKVFLSDEGAEDIVQDVMLGVWRRREILDENYDPCIYIFRSIYNRSLNYLKREQLASDFRSWNERRIAMYEHETLDPDRNPVVRRLLDGDLKDSLLKAIDALPPKRQEIIRMHFVEEIPNKEIAKRLGISLSTVENHINAALKKMRATLSEEEFMLILLLLPIHAIFMN